MANKDTAKQWFKTGDKPTQVQFYQVFDWLRWKDEPLTVDDVQGLADLLQQLGASGGNQGEKKEFNGDGNYQIPAGYLLEQAIVLPGSDATIRLGTVEGSDDIIPDIDVSADGYPLTLNIYTRNGRTIYITGLPANSIIIFFKKAVTFL